MTISVYFAVAFYQGAELIVTLKRLENFLLHDEISNSNPNLIKHVYNALDSNGDVIKPKKSQYAIDVDHVTACWTSISDALVDINLKIPPGRLCALVGTVASGKV